MKVLGGVAWQGKGLSSELPVAGQGRACQEGEESGCQQERRLWRSKRDVLVNRGDCGTPNSTPSPTNLSLPLQD